MITAQLVQSIIVGSIFGLLWGNLFADKYRRLSKAGTNAGEARSSLWILASTSVIRYLLLAALLAILIIKSYITLVWWLVGFMPSFWTILIRATRIK